MPVPPSLQTWSFDRTRPLRVEVACMFLMVRRSESGGVPSSTISPHVHLAAAFGTKVNCGSMTRRSPKTIRIGPEESEIPDK